MGPIMALTYFKRFRMELDLTEPLFARPSCAYAYQLLPWQEDLMGAHAEAKYLSFRLEIDANVFPCLGDREGCHRLMTEITRRDTFVPEATWLLRHQLPERSEPDYCGTIQGIVDKRGCGAIQNIGVTPQHRGKGLGTVLLHQALQGFQKAELDRCFLEVTADNLGAVRLYQRLGFRKIRTVYKASHMIYS